MVNSIRIWYKSKTGHYQKLSQYVRTYGIAKDMNSLTFPSSLFIWRHLSFSKYQQVWFTSQARKQQTLHTILLTVLKLYSITQQDLFRPINDTTALVLLMGRLIVGCKDPGTCGMHKSKLIIQHAMGQVARKYNKQVVDSFPEMDMFRSILEVCCIYNGYKTEIKI